MTRPFRPFDYAAGLQQTISDLLPAAHPARQLVAFLETVDLAPLYRLYLPAGAPPIDPRLLLGLWLYGYMTGQVSSRQLERATSEQVPCVYLAAGTHPDHSTLAEFRTLVFAFLPDLFAQLLTQAQADGHLTMAAVSHDGTKVHADASKHQAVSYQRAGELIHELQEQIEDLLHRAQHAPASLPADMTLAEEIATRRARIARLQEARAVLEARADERYAAELAAHEERLAARAERERVTGKQPRGKPPAPPTPGAKPTDQYNFTDPDSRIMKNSANSGFDQHYNGQVTVEHASRLIVGCHVAPQASDRPLAAPTFDTIPATLGTPQAACLDSGFWSPTTAEELAQRGITPYIATGKTTHGLTWHRYYRTTPDAPPPATDASPKAHMAYRLQTAAGQALYRLRKSTVEPVIGILKEVLGFRQFSVRGLANVQGEWQLLCLAYNLKRLFTLRAAATTPTARGVACPPCRSRRPASPLAAPASSRAIVWFLKRTHCSLPTGC